MYKLVVGEYECGMGYGSAGFERLVTLGELIRVQFGRSWALLEKTSSGRWELLPIEEV